VRFADFDTRRRLIESLHTSTLNENIFDDLIVMGDGALDDGDTRWLAILLFYVRGMKGELSRTLDYELRRTGFLPYDLTARHKSTTPHLARMETVYHNDVSLRKKYTKFYGWVAANVDRHAHEWRLEIRKFFADPEMALAGEVCNNKHYQKAKATPKRFAIARTT